MQRTVSFCEASKTQILTATSQRDKRFSGTVKLPTVPRPRMSIWYGTSLSDLVDEQSADQGLSVRSILGDQHDIDRAKHVGVDAMSSEDLKKLNKNKKVFEYSTNCGFAANSS